MGQFSAGKVGQISTGINTYFIDSKTGNVIDIQNNITQGSISGTVKGSYWPQHHYDQVVSYVQFITNDIKIVSSGLTVSSANTDQNGNYSVDNLGTGIYTISFPLADSYCAVKDNNTFLKGIIVEERKAVTGDVVNKVWGISDASNVKWHVRVGHDFFKNTFNFTNMDYTLDAYINCGSSINGQNTDEELMFGSENGFYWARASDVIYHEYSHIVIRKIYGDNIGTSGEAGAMNEGFPDYFACSINNDFLYGESVATYSQRNLKNTYIFNPNEIDIHVNGQAISGACWDLRELIGASLANNLVFRGLQVSPKANKFSDYLLNILVADQIYYNSTHFNQILTAFANHGIFPPDLMMTISGPASLNSYQYGTWMANVSGGVPPYSYKWSIYYPCGGILLAKNVVNPNAFPCGSWFETYTTASSITRYDSRSHELKCTVTDATNKIVSSIMDVSIAGDGGLYKSIPESTDNGFKDNNIIDYNLEQNHPNPFNPSTTINYQIPAAGFVTIKVYNILGKEISTLVNEFKIKGRYSTEFEAKNLPSGLYIYEMRVNEYTASKKLLLTK